MKLVRTQSLAHAREYRVSINQSLPLLDPPSFVRSEDEVFDRMVCMTALAGSAYGFDRARAMEWLRKESVDGQLTPVERKYLQGGYRDAELYIAYIEGIWALAWTLGIVGDLNFRQPCHPEFATLMPHPKVVGSVAELRSKSRLRPVEKIVAKLDLAYCLHWAVRQATLMGNSIQTIADPEVIVERRRALEWCLSDEEWDNVNMDT